MCDKFQPVMVDLSPASLESGNDMPRRKQKPKHKRDDSVLGKQVRQRRLERSLGYKNTDEYEKGLGVVKRLLANKNKCDSEGTCLTQKP